MENLTRRRFLRSAAVLGAGTWLCGGQTVFAQTNTEDLQLPDLVAVRNGEPDVMFDRGIAAIGGIKRFVKKGQTVVVKPNMGWDRAPETGANTNPLLVGRIVQHCLEAGAKKVYVFDNTCSNPQRAYQNSGIESAAKSAGALIVPANSERYYQHMSIPSAKVLKTTKVHELYLEADVIINVPVIKHHGSARLTASIKNLMGVVWDRRWYHRHDLHQAIADFCLYRKPELNVVDAYRITLANGPSRARPQDLALKRSLLISNDIVAADAAAAKILGVEPESIKYINYAHTMKQGRMKLNDLGIKKIVL